jgi:hypothetical protein
MQNIISRSGKQNVVQKLEQKGAKSVLKSEHTKKKKTQKIMLSACHASILTR